MRRLPAAAGTPQTREVSGTLLQFDCLSVRMKTNAGWVPSATTHRQDIDGVRAIAVLLVVLYHAGGGFPGVFLGVDGFFVISGCLITGLVPPVQRLDLLTQQAGSAVVDPLPALPRPRRLLQVQQTARLVTAAVIICQFPVRFTVSALLTVYNRAHILTEAVHSLLNSGDRDLEIVLVEDFAPDASWPLCQTLAEASPLVHAFRNDKNLGDCANRNGAASLARGKYFSTSMPMI
jgi:hypothetical protein